MRNPHLHHHCLWLFTYHSAHYPLLDIWWLSDDKHSRVVPHLDHFHRKGRFAFQWRVRGEVPEHEGVCVGDHCPLDRRIEATRWQKSNGTHASQYGGLASHVGTCHLSPVAVSDGCTFTNATQCWTPCQQHKRNCQSPDMTDFHRLRSKHLEQRHYCRLQKSKQPMCWPCSYCTSCTWRHYILNYFGTFAMVIFITAIIVIATVVAIIGEISSVWSKSEKSNLKT